MLKSAGGTSKTVLQPTSPLAAILTAALAKERLLSCHSFVHMV